MSATAVKNATFMYMSNLVGVAELRQNLSVYLRRIAHGLNEWRSRGG